MDFLYFYYLGTCLWLPDFLSVHPSQKIFSTFILSTYLLKRRFEFLVLCAILFFVSHTLGPASRAFPVHWCLSTALSVRMK